MRQCLVLERQDSQPHFEDTSTLCNTHLSRTISKSTRSKSTCYDLAHVSLLRDQSQRRRNSFDEPTGQMPPPFVFP